MSKHLEDRDSWLQYLEERTLAWARIREIDAEIRVLAAERMRLSRKWL